MNPRGIHLATGNAHKVQEFQRLADESGLEVKMIATAQMPPVVEDTGTFTGNARKKALALKAVLPADAWVLADDSGLCVDALCGAPGVESAYFAGPAGDSAANLAKLVTVMRAVPPDHRGAHFTCVLVLLGPGEANRCSRAGARAGCAGSRSVARDLAMIRFLCRRGLTGPMPSSRRG
jgi:XTP/dITP diphosphohydrolase